MEGFVRLELANMRNPFIGEDNRIYPSSDGHELERKISNILQLKFRDSTDILQLSIGSRKT